MKIVKEIEPRDFDYWSGAADRVCNLTKEDWDIIEPIIEELAENENWSDTTLNDFFWFEFDTVAQWLGYDNEADMDRKRNPNYIDDDELLDYAADWFQVFIKELFDQNDNKSHKLLKDIAENLFGYEPEGEPGPDDYLDYYDYLKWQTDNQDVWDSIFYDDCGSYETKGAIPTIEKFRELVMNKY